MNLTGRKRSGLRKITRSIDLSWTDLYVLTVIIGVVLILTIFQHIFWHPAFEENNHRGLILKQDKPININTASYQILQELPGIGPVLAQRIIEYREARGGFSNLEEIIKIKGIGQKTYDSLKGKITLGQP